MSSTNFPTTKLVILHPEKPGYFLVIKQEIDGEPVYGLPGGRLDFNPETKFIENFEQAAVHPSYQGLEEILLALDLPTD